jgi:signal transduction histidine kinase
VKSSGDPIEEDEMEKIFQPFYRSANASGTHGFGLGLALAQRIIGLHKGYLHVISGVESGGTIFSIYLPTASVNGNEKEEAKA